MATETITVEAITRRKRRFRLRGWLIWLVILLGLGGAGYWYMAQGASTEPVVRYTTAPVAKGDITVTVTAVGTVEPIEEVNVGSLISGTISDVAVSINDQVKQGQVLARLDTSSLEAGLARDLASQTAAKAQVEDAKAGQEAAVAALARAEKMRARGLNSEEDLATALTAKRRADAAVAIAEANVHVAEADVKLAESNIAKAVIVAPIDGMVLDMTADLGQTVSASGTTVTLFTLAHDLGQMELKVDVSEADIGRVEVGDVAQFGVDAYQGQLFPAKVSALYFSPQKVDGIVTYPTILAIDNSDHKLRPGMTASADITVEHAKGVLTVPNAAFRYTPPVTRPTQQRSSGLLGMLFAGGGPGPQARQRTSVTNEVTKDGFRNLYILKDGKPEQIAVKTGVTDGDATEVLEGPLAEGDMVVTAQQTVTK